MERKKYSAVKILLICMAVFFGLGLLAAPFIGVDFPATDSDIIYYRLSVFCLFATLEVGVLLELNVLNLRKRIPLINSLSVYKHLCFFGIVIIIAVILFMIPYSLTSADFRERLSDNNDINEEPIENTGNEYEIGDVTADEDSAETTEIHSETTVNEVSEKESQIIIEESEAVQNEFATEVNPLIMTFEGHESNVGCCTVMLKKIEIYNAVFKAHSYAKPIRIRVSVTNNSSEQTVITMRKPGSFRIGKYYGEGESIYIGTNSNYSWAEKSEIDSSATLTLAPNETADMVCTGVFINGDKIGYTDLPRLELYFVNGEDMLTVEVNGD